MKKKTISDLKLNSIKIKATITVIGPVGPDICLGVPPNKEAKNPTNIAPYNPVSAPIPELTPKARPRGRATTAAVIPPNRSCLI